MQGRPLEHKTINQDASPAECPVSLDTMKDAVVTNCGHAFDSTSVTVGKNCPSCQTPITALTRSTSVNSMVIHITQQEKTQANLLAELQVLKTKLAEQAGVIQTQHKTIQLLTPAESKSKGEISPDLRTAFAMEPSIAQQIADAEYLQKITYLQRIMLSYFVRKYTTQFLETRKNIVQAKKELQAAHVKKLSDIKASILQLGNQINPSNSILDEKNDDTPHILETINQQSKEGQQAKEDFLKKKKNLFVEYVNNIFCILPKVAGKKYTWKIINQQIQEQQKKLQTLYQTQQDAHQQTGELIQQKRTNTYSIFGGTKEPQKMPASLEETTKLWEAVKANKFDAACELLKTRSFNLNVRHEKDLTLLAYAIQKENTQMMEILINRGANVNITLNRGNARDVSLLSYVISLEKRSDSQIMMLTVLLKYKAILDLANTLGQTALHYAAWYHDIPAIKILQEHNANPFIKTTSNQTPRDLAKQSSLVMKKDNPTLAEAVDALLLQGEKAFKLIPSAPPQMPATVASSSSDATPPPSAAPQAGR